MGINWLNFTQVDQVEVELRTSFKQSLLSTGKLNISKECIIFYNELLQAVWDLKSTKPKLLPSCPDHMMDAFDYAMSPWYEEFYSKHFSNSYYFKTSKSSFRKEVT